MNAVQMCGRHISHVMSPLFVCSSVIKRKWTWLSLEELNFFYNCIVPVEFLSWEIRVAFPGESQLWQSCATQPTVHAWCFECFHNPSNSEMGYRIFNEHTDVNACSCTRGVQTHIRESALKVDNGRKIPCSNGGIEPASAAWRSDALTN